MRKRYLQMTLVGVGGLAALALAYAGRRGISELWNQVQRTPEKLLEWNEAAERELDRIETALNRVAKSLDSVR